MFTTYEALTPRSTLWMLLQIVIKFIKKGEARVEGVSSMFVCVCRAVPETAVLRVIRDGASNLDEVAARCGAGSSCGACRPTLLRMLANCDEEDGAGCGECPRRVAATFSPSLSPSGL